MTDNYVMARLYFDVQRMPDPEGAWPVLLEALRLEGDDSAAVTLVQSGEAHVDLIAAAGAKTELARVALGLVQTAPVHTIGWLSPDMTVDRDTFLNVLAPAPAETAQSASSAAADTPRPARVVPLEGRARTPRPTRRATLRMDRETQLELTEGLIRHGLTAQATKEEVTDLRRELGIGSPERRAACQALITTSALIAANASQAAASVLTVF